MASRAELIQCCKELGINSKGLLIDNMKELIRAEADKLYYNKSYRIAADTLSEVLLKFLTLEHDFKLFDQKKNQLNWDYRKKDLTNKD